MICKRDFIRRLADRGYTISAASTILDDVLETMMETFVDNESIQFFGFGTFNVKESAPREMVDYQSKERIVAPGRKVVRFSPGKRLKRALMEGILRDE